MLEGFTEIQADREPARTLPADWTWKKICLRVCGGIGDAVMAIGGTALALKEKHPCIVTGAVSEFQMPLIRQMEGVDAVVPFTALNDPVKLCGYDVLIEFGGVFNLRRVLRAAEYYGLVSAKVGFQVGPGKFRFKHKPVDSPLMVALHPGASNPNRRWIDDRWGDLAEALAARCFRVVWLGTRDEYGWHDPPTFTKLSDQSDDLLWQAECLAEVHKFVGNDSGFAHVAGCLGVPGVVLFAVTSAEHVIASYPTLAGIDAYDRIGVVPSRSMDVDDPIAIRASQAITVDDVLKALGVFSLPCTRVQTDRGVGRRYKALVLAGADERVVKEIGTFTDLTFGAVDQTRWGEFDVIIVVTDRSTMVSNKGRPPWLYLNREVAGEVARRAIREIIKAKGPNNADP